MRCLAERAVGRVLPRQIHHGGQLSLPLVGLFGAGTGGLAAPVVCPTCWLLTNKPCTRGWTNTTEKQTVIRTHTRKKCSLSFKMLSGS